ncbi:MAG: phage holin family protein [Actinobacteria bacterium]|nr:phage holin family protein [Actinomycetota bacterium]
MPTQGTNGRQVHGLGAAVKEVAERASAIVRLELELAAMELRRKVVALGLGIAFLLGAAVLLVFMLGFGFATIAAALATAMPTWAALLVTTGILFLLSGVLGVLGLAKIRKGTPPVPEQAIREAKLTTEALKTDGR